MPPDALYNKFIVGTSVVVQKIVSDVCVCVSNLKKKYFDHVLLYTGGVSCKHKDFGFLTLLFFYIICHSLHFSHTIRCAAVVLLSQFKFKANNLDSCLFQYKALQCDHYRIVITVNELNSRKIEKRLYFMATAAIVSYVTQSKGSTWQHVFYAYG